MNDKKKCSKIVLVKRTTRFWLTFCIWGHVKQERETEGTFLLESIVSLSLSLARLENRAKFQCLIYIQYMILKNANFDLFRAKKIQEWLDGIKKLARFEIAALFIRLYSEGKSAAISKAVDFLGHVVSFLYYLTSNSFKRDSVVQQVIILYQFLQV